MKALDDKRLGLLFRMLGFGACVCVKRIQEPLVKRGYTKLVRESTYELTPQGRSFVKAEVKRRQKSKQVHLVTWPVLGIGNCVLIVQHNDRREKR